MPPPVYRSPICSLSGSLASARPSRCSPSLLSLAHPSRYQSKTFSTTPAAHNGAVPPQSPKYLTVPEPPQSSEVRLPPIRGHLPVPRQVFSRRDGARKVQPGYVERATPRSQAELTGEPPRNELDAWRRRMADTRRKSLAAGLQGLWRRKERQERRERERTAARIEAHRRAATAPEGLDEVLTRPTVRASTADDVAVRPDPQRFALAEARGARTAARQQAESEARRDALAELYIAAKDFIVTEEELEETVERIFTEDYFRKLGSVAIDSANIWDARGSPVSLSGMVAAANRTQTSLISASQAESTRTTKRQKIVAEELTGGKMP